MTCAPLYLKINHVLSLGTVFGISLFFLAPSRFRSWLRGDNVFSPLSRRRSRRPEQEC